jgi:predicted NBD/HSP70 family sugar kinase
MATSARPDPRARIVSALVQAGALSRAELARRTALAASTVTSVVSELQADGLLVEPATPAHPPARSTIGRPPILIGLHRRAGIAAGIDFGKRHVRVVLSDLAHTILAERHQALEDDLPAAEAIALAGHLLDQARAEAGVEHAEIVGVGMGLPGPIRLPSGELGDFTILPGWVGVHAAQAVGDALGHAVVVGNDANVGALAEWMWGAGRGADPIAYVKAATGVGAGFVIDGKPFLGAGGTAGEIGHTVIDPHGPICRCGNRGCLETLAGAPAVLAALHKIHGEELTLADAIAHARQGDVGCRRAIADAGVAIGTAVATLCNLFNPRRIVVGGDLGAAGDLLLEPLRESLRRGAIRSAAEDVEIVQGALGERAEALGAVALILRQGTYLAATRT